jgi:dephospho-CoA kinase
MPFIGLTGGFGTGKTTVLHLMKNLGAHTISADSIVHGLLKKPSIIRKLVLVLGKDILIKRLSKSYINKKRMADIIFNNVQMRKSVEKILHPEVLQTSMQIKKQIQRKNKRAVIVFEVPLLFEAGYRNIFDATIMVYCSRTTALRRLMTTGLSEKEIKQRMKAQMPLSKKKALADFVVNNNSDLRSTRNQVKALFNFF